MGAWRIVKARLGQGQQTLAYPDAPAKLPAGFRGRPVVKPGPCPSGCATCVESCPTDALRSYGGLQLDLGRCVFCAACVEACPSGLVTMSADHRMATSRRKDLALYGGEPALACSLDRESRRLFGRSLKLRQVSAGGCNGCESELAALGNVVFDLSRFGVQFVASPRHADGLVVTGPVSEHMREALLATYAATPAPKLVLAVGACAISGGIFAPSPQVHGGLDGILPVDLYVPGCPPHPLTVLDGLLRLLGRLPSDR